MTATVTDIAVRQYRDIAVEFVDWIQLHTDDGYSKEDAVEGARFLLYLNYNTQELDMVGLNKAIQYELTKRGLK